MHSLISFWCQRGHGAHRVAHLTEHTRKIILIMNTCHCIGFNPVKINSQRNSSKVNAILIKTTVITDFCYFTAVIPFSNTENESCFSGAVKPRFQDHHFSKTKQKYFHLLFSEKVVTFVVKQMPQEILSCLFC